MTQSSIGGLCQAGRAGLISFVLAGPAVRVVRIDGRRATAVSLVRRFGGTRLWRSG